MLYEQVRDKYKPVEQLKEELEEHIEKIREGMSEEFVEKYRKAYNPLFEFLEKQEMLVKRLVKIAEEKSIEEALQKETIYGVIRETFPTPKEYANYVLCGIEAVRAFMVQVHNTLNVDDEEKQRLAKTIESIRRAIEETKKDDEEIYGDYIKRKIREIYGDK